MDSGETPPPQRKRSPRSKPARSRVRKTKGASRSENELLPMPVSSLIANTPDIVSGKDEIVLMTRVRLARNLANMRFPGWADEALRKSIAGLCREAISRARFMGQRYEADIAELAPVERQMLVERHLISKELASCRPGSGVVINGDQSISIMINEEDHLRIQGIMPGLDLLELWKKVDSLDSDIESQLDYAFSSRLGYLTACPTNLGTAMRASAMMHLPALVINGDMEKVIRAVGQLGMVVRGFFGEGSDASGSVFQISNQVSLGQSETQIITRLSNVLQTIIESENNAREKLLETKKEMLLDRLGRAYGILRNAHLLSSAESLNLLSLVRLGVDLGIFPKKCRQMVDRMLIETQPGHIQYGIKKELDPEERDILRAERMRTAFGNFPKPNLKKE